MERFPTLKFVTAENGTDWLPWFLGRLAKKNRSGNLYGTPLTLTPLEYFHRQVFVTYIDEPEAIEAKDIIGVDNLMFSTDYPHTAATWPKSQEVVERDAQHLTAEERRKLVRDNTLRVFGIRAAVPA
jgi:predicted TIM-barrel fold metal-dependent hydrolase